MVWANNTVGHRSLARRKNSTSGALSSAEASLTKINPSANGRKLSVAAACPAPSPPIPGVSTITRPCLSNGLGTTMSTRSTRLWLPGLPASLTQSPTCSIGIVSVVGGSPAAPDSALRRTTAPGCSPHRTSVIADVARSSSTGQTDCPSRALISELLPCLNSPTTHTTVTGRRSRAAATDARSARSARPIC